MTGVQAWALPIFDDFDDLTDGEEATDNTFDDDIPF
mgnify:CR=1 FL=1